MSEPVAWRFRFPTGGRWWYSEYGPNEHSKPQLIWEPLYASSPTYAMGVADATRAGGDLYRNDRSELISFDEGYNEAYNEGYNEAVAECREAIRALSSPPSVSDEWIEDRLENLDENGYTGNGQRLAILATLAALGITVEGAAK